MKIIHQELIMRKFEDAKHETY